MSIEVTCPNPECRRRLRLRDELVGHRVKCPDCEGIITVAVGVPEPDPMIGKRIAHYQILAKIGQGGMGSVYRARNLRLSKIVALKLLPASLMAKDRSFLERFIREAQSAAQLEHPNVVTVHFVGSDAGHYFIEMQYVDGKTLAEILRDPQGLTVSQATRIITDAARALQAAHTKGIVHRDIKPENIMLTVDGQVKVADFGLAGLGGAGEAVVTGGKVLGTPYYMSPEHCRGEATDARSDIYSLGATFYHALTGKPPFFGPPLQEVVKLQVTKPLPPAKETVPSLPNAVNDVVMKMLAKKREDRYQSCADLVADLERVEGALVPPATVATGFDEVEEVRPASALTRAAVSVVIVLLVVAGTLAGVFLIARGLAAKKDKKPKHHAAPLQPIPAERPEQAQPQVPAPAAVQAPAVPTIPPAPAVVASPARPEQAAGATPAPASPTPPAPQGQTIPEVSLLPEAGKPPAPPAPEATEAEPPPTGPEEKPHVDLQEYARAVFPIDQLIDERNYADAAAKTNVLGAKVKNGEERAAMKRANIDRLKNQWQKIHADVKSGKLRPAMKDISRRYGYAGTLIEINESGLVAQTGNTSVPVRWDRLTKEDLLNLWALACGGKDAESALTLAAFCMEGTQKMLDKAEIYLGIAAEHGADIRQAVEEVGFLRRASPFAPAAEKEEKPKEKAAVEEEQEQKPEKKEEEQAAISWSSSRKEFKPGVRYPLDYLGQLSSQNVNLPGRVRFMRGKKGGAIELLRQPIYLPANLPKEDGAFEFWVKVSGPERKPFALIFAASPDMGGSERINPLSAYVGDGMRVVFPRPPGVEPGTLILDTSAKIEDDTWTHVAVEWGEQGYRAYVNEELSAHQQDTYGLLADVASIGFCRWLVMTEDGGIPEAKMEVLLDDVALYYPKKKRSRN